ncbi:MAG: 2-dehydropantoate 2-reductase [Alphaproteobacteria bacterium]|jgi:2-dehydropantoate 2-reductase|nr:2-dehydropantoate 2-reductase [Alphaproteobacteria bacterium]
MKIGILGAGAMGCVYGAHFHEAGHEVWLIDRWAEHVAAIAANGLRVEGMSGDRTLDIAASGDPAEVGACQLVVVATKADDTEVAVRGAAALMGNQTNVLVIQNGLGALERMAPLVPPERLILGIAGGFGSSVEEPGRVHHNGMRFVHMAAAEGAADGRVRDCVEIWRGAGFTAEAFDDAQSMIWGKMLGNIAFSAVSTVTGLRLGQVVSNPEAFALSCACVEEAAALAAAKAITLPYDDPIAFIRDFAGGMPKARPSVMLDLLAGRRSEIDYLNGAVAREAPLLGLEAPVNAVMAQAVRALEQKAADLGQAYGVV